MFACFVLWIGACVVWVLFGSGGWRSGVFAGWVGCVIGGLIDCAASGVWICVAIFCLCD